MEMLKETNPVFQKFEVNGNFTVARTKNRFSTMGLDQRHEQLNKDVKGGGLIFGGGYLVFGGGYLVSDLLS